MGDLSIGEGREVRDTYRHDCVGKIGGIGNVVHAEIEVAKDGQAYTRR